MTAGVEEGPDADHAADILNAVPAGQTPDRRDRQGNEEQRERVPAAAVDELFSRVRTEIALPGQHDIGKRQRCEDRERLPQKADERHCAGDEDRRIEEARLQKRVDRLRESSHATQKFFARSMPVYKLAT